MFSLKTVKRVSYVSKINRKDFITEKLNSEEAKVSTSLKLNLPLGQSTADRCGVSLVGIMVPG